MTHKIYDIKDGVAAIIIDVDEEFVQDLFINPEDINGALNGDRVMAEITKPATEGRRAEEAAAEADAGRGVPVDGKRLGQLLCVL